MKRDCNFPISKGLWQMNLKKKKKNHWIYFFFKFLLDDLEMSKDDRFHPGLV